MTNFYYLRGANKIFSNLFCPFLKSVIINREVLDPLLHDFTDLKERRKKAVTESSHNLTGVKTILSVRAQWQHSFVFDKMIPTLVFILFGTRSISTTPPTVRCSMPPPLTTVYNKFITNSPLVSLLSFLFVLTRKRQNGDYYAIY